MKDNATKIILAICWVIVAIVATIGSFTLVASIGNTSPILWVLGIAVIIAIDSAIFHFISSYLK